MNTLKRLIATILFIPTISFAINEGDTLPSINFDNPGRMVITKGNDYQFVNWSSSKLAGKKWVIQYLSPRPNVGAENTHLNNALAKHEKAHEFCNTVSIINLDEALWGTQSIAKSRMAGGLKLNKKCIIVADDESKGLKKWSLKKKSNSTFVIDENAHVIFFHHGKLSDKHVEKIIGLIVGIPTDQKSAPTIE